MSLSPEYTAMMARPEAEQYAALQERFDKLIVAAKQLEAEAVKAGDPDTVEHMNEIILQLEYQKSTMRKPGEAPK